MFSFMQNSIEQIQGTYASDSRTLIMVHTQHITALPIAIYLRVVHKPVQGWP